MKEKVVYSSENGSVSVSDTLQSAEDEVLSWDIKMYSSGCFLLKQLKDYLK